MATSKFKPTPGFKQPKFPLYQSLYQINRAFEAIHYHLEILDDYEVFPLALLQQFGAAAGELRAGINHMIVDKLQTRETEDWAHFGRMRATIEARLKQ